MRWGGYGYDGDYEEPYEYSGEVIVRKCGKLKVNLFTPLVGKWKKEKLLKEGWKEMPSIVEGCEHYFDLNKELKEKEAAIDMAYNRLWKINR